MDDLISRESVKRLTTKRNNIWNEVTDAEGRGLDEILDSLPSIDAVPVKHAKLLDASPVGLCSECGFMMDYREEFNYCPNCGARMDGVENG